MYTTIRRGIAEIGISATLGKEDRRGGETFSPRSMLTRTLRAGGRSAGPLPRCLLRRQVSTTILPAPSKESPGWSWYEDPTRRGLEVLGHKAFFTFEPAATTAAASSSPAPVVVCVHGAPGSTFDFRYLGPSVTGNRALANNEKAKLQPRPSNAVTEHTPFLPVIRLDVPGHGESDRGIVSSPSGPDLADGFLATLEAIAAAEPQAKARIAQDGIVIAAHSLGAELALHAAAEIVRRRQASSSSGSGGSGSSFAPQLRGLVLINPVGLRPHKALRPFWLAQAMGRALSWPSPFGRWMLELLYVFWIRVFGFSARTKKSEIEWGQLRVSARDFAVLEQDVRLLAQYSPAAAVSSKPGGAVPIPTVVACAEDDHLVEPAVPTELAEALGSVKLLRSKGGGHYLNKFGADAVAKAIQEDLKPFW